MRQTYEQSSEYFFTYIYTITKYNESLQLGTQHLKRALTTFDLALNLGTCLRWPLKQLAK